MLYSSLDYCIIYNTQLHGKSHVSLSSFFSYNRSITGMVLQCKNKVLSILLCPLDVVFEGHFRKWGPSLSDLLAVHGAIQDDLISNGDATHMCRVISLVHYTKKVASFLSLKKHPYYTKF